MHSGATWTELNDLLKLSHIAEKNITALRANAQPPMAVSDDTLDDLLDKATRMDTGLTRQVLRRRHLLVLEEERRERAERMALREQERKQAAAKQGANR